MHFELQVEVDSGHPQAVEAEAAGRPHDRWVEGEGEAEAALRCQSGLEAGACSVSTKGIHVQHRTSMRHTPHEFLLAVSKPALAAEFAFSTIAAQRVFVVLRAARHTGSGCGFGWIT